MTMGNDQTIKHIQRLSIQIKGGKAQSLLAKRPQDISTALNNPDMNMKKKNQTLEEKKKLFLEILQLPALTQL